MRRFNRAAVCLVAILGAGSVRAAAVTQPATAIMPVKIERLTLPLGRSAIIETDQPIGSIINPNPKLVSTELSGRRKLVLFGLTEGTSELRLMNTAGVQFKILEIEVSQDVQAFQGLLDEALESHKVTIRRVGTSLVLSGEVSSPAEMALATETIQRAAGPNAPVINLIKQRGGDQITLAVRVLEVKTSRLKSLGLKWAVLNNQTATGVNQLGNVFDSGVLTRPTDLFSFAASSTFKVGKTVVDSFVDFLRTEGEARLLAEPTIVTTSGKGAKFLSGGEFPVPVPYAIGGSSSTTGAGANTFAGITYKQYGISLSVNATIELGGTVSLHVAPEVSSIDYVNSIEYGGNKVPALATRRAETDLRMNSGETVILAGLTSRATDKESNRLPIGGTRFFDFLAGPQSYSDQETELIIIVTPTIGTVVHPAPNVAAAMSDPHVAH